MLYPIKVIDIELSKPIPTVKGLEGYMGLQGLVRLHGVPLGYIKAPISLGKCTAATLGKLILEEHSEAIICQLLKNGLASPHRPAEFKLEDLLNLPPVEYTGEWPLVTVAVCTRDRPDDIKLCLEAIAQLDYPSLDILVVDNAPTTESTKDLIDYHYPQVRYVREPRPGLDWARNRAILEAQGEIIAYTDDDVVVDRDWVKAIALAFSEHPEVMAVTGLVVPYELETEAQVLFESYGGFGRGFEQKRYCTDPGKPMSWQWLGAGQFGTGANMAYRRSVFETIGCFDPALDVGTPTNGCGDLEMFIRVIKSGHILIYEPQAMIRHRHRREYAQLKRQISFNGSLYALWISLGSTYADLWFSCLKVGIWWMLYWNVRRIIVSFFHQTQFPKDLVFSEFYGAFSGFTSYQKSKKVVASIVKKYGWQTEQPLPTRYNSNGDFSIKPSLSRQIAIREVELSKPLHSLTELEKYSRVRIYISWHNSPIGSLDYQNLNSNVLQLTLSREIVKKFYRLLLDPSKSKVSDVVWSSTIKAIGNHYSLINETDSESIPDNISVSVIVGTFDRPDDLRSCLTHLQRQITNRKFKIIVVDNHPQSEILLPLKGDFPEILWVDEPRQGVAYARNAGINASASDIVITIDDDVTVPHDWMEKLIKPLANSQVMAVTGNILPLELETESQQKFEYYGGLGRGFESFSADGDWYDLFPHKPSPVWDLGGTANSAFRAEIFSHPEIGLMDESLGPGMPSGVGEDSYLFYKIIKAGYTVTYEPKGFVWHRHRRTNQALNKQIYNYSKGHVSHNLTTWLRDGDYRGLAQVLLGLPYAHYYRIKEYILKRSNYPITLIWLEIRGNLAGPWSLWRSRVRVHKQGRSQPYIPIHNRPN
ncbi:glycosyltransferase [Nodosilinea sp. FACHB-13]|uniref:glycosyltransferase family 2 protein n=1 Tax=Cyanophyceae TaxID=3028117 RepID=UPI001683BDF9|nr:glycosyltransferase [Nodosilinea sp. FACHB-13]MBD2109853.1 glycosyltransferase [Nodosilinea sp. FACHB-13]